MNDKEKVWDRLKNGMQESEFAELQRLASDHFNSEGFNKWKEELQEEYSEVSINEKYKRK